MKANQPFREETAILTANPRYHNWNKSQYLRQSFTKKKQQNKHPVLEPWINGVHRYRP